MHRKPAVNQMNAYVILLVKKALVVAHEHLTLDL